jgi:tryptophan synthase alpha chain
MLEAEIRKRRKTREILLMTHIVLGYPSFDASRRIVAQMVEAGVDLMELQIPFSEPIGDGQVILHANQRALHAGASVGRCFELAAQICAEYPIPFVFMTYYNVVLQRGVERFARETRAAGLHGAILADLPLEEGNELFNAFDVAKLDPIFIYSPNTSASRMQAIAKRARGFTYCVARKGVTGATTDFSALEQYMERCAESTRLPLAVGFGVKSRADVAKLVNQADIAVVGSETVRIVDQSGVKAVGQFVRSLR